METATNTETSARPSRCTEISRSAEPGPTPELPGGGLQCGRRDMRGVAAIRIWDGRHDQRDVLDLVLGLWVISNPLSPTDIIYGLVSQQGIFVGSTTESGYNDLFVAAPLSSPMATNATFKGSTGLRTWIFQAARREARSATCIR